MQKKDKLLEKFNEQPTTTKIIIVVVALIVVFIVVKKAKEAYNQWQIGNLDRSPQGTETSRDIRPLVDQIYKNLDGPNAFVYPEIVNKIANLSDTELKNANDYWASEYSGVTGESLYSFINGEWDGGVYDPALEKLERKGYA